MWSARKLAAAVVGLALVTTAVEALHAAGPDAGTGPAAAAAEPPKAPNPNVRIVVTVLPSTTKKAMVTWGKKKLGVIAPRQPLVIQRPRDSGPLDLVVRADKCLPVQTRAYTFADNKLIVKLTPLEQKNTLLGYREELPPPDAGAPPSQSPDAGAM